MNKTLKIALHSRVFKLATLAGIALAAVFGLLPTEVATFGPLLLLNIDDAGASAAAPAPGSVASAPPPAAATPAGGSPAADGGVSTKPDTRSKGERAAERAAARLAGKAGATNHIPTTVSSDQQAPAGDPAGGTSTGTDDAAGKTAAPASTTADGEGTPKGAAAPASTVTVPTDWPTEDLERMNKLPDDGKQIVLDIHKRMHAGFTHAMTKLSEEKTGLKDVVAIRDQFNTDPKAAIAVLAKRANLEVFFERPGPEEVIPDDILNDPKKYAKYIADKAVKEAQKVFTSELEERDTQSQTQAATTQLQREIADASSAHTDFAEHRGAVVALLQKAPALTVEEAYRLTTYEALGKRAAEGEKAKRELAALKAESERKAKASTAPPAGAAAPGAPSGEDKTLSLGERAYRKAGARLAANGNRTVNS